MAQFINNLKAKTLITFDANGSLDFQDPNNAANSIALMPNAANAGSLMFTKNMFGRIFMSFYNPDLSPAGPVRYWDGVRQTAIPITPFQVLNVSDSATVGAWAAGTYPISVFYETVDHVFLQAATATWITAGGKQLSLTNIPDGVNFGGISGVIARWICVAIPGANPIVYYRFPTMRIADNTTHAATFDSPGANFLQVGSPTDTLVLPGPLVNATQNAPPLAHLSPDGPGAPPTVVDSANAGSIAVGTHFVWVVFETLFGYLTAPSPAGSWSAAGGFKAVISDIPIGPWYVNARRLLFSSAGGADMFYVATFRIPDNTTQAVEVDFTDTNLLQGSNFNYLTKNVSIAPAMGVGQYGGRSSLWGMLNNIRGIGLNLNFDGGWNQSTGEPLGWMGDATFFAGGIREVFSAYAGDAWRMTGDGATAGRGEILNGQYANISTATEAGTVVTITTSAPHRFAVGQYVLIKGVGVAGYNSFSNGMIPTLITSVPSPTTFTYTATAGLGNSSGGIALLSLLAPLLAPNTPYSISIRAKADAGIVAPQASLLVELYSPSSDITFGSLNLLGSAIAQNWTEYSGQLTIGLGSIPQDLTLRVSTNHTVDNGKRIWIDHITLFPSNAKFEPSVLRISNPFDPETFDGVDGIELIAKDNGEAITAVVQLRAFLYILKERSMHVTWDDTINPAALWVTRQIDSTIGCGSPRALVSSDTLLGWSFRSGAYLFTGSRPTKISQEIHTTWQQIQWSSSGLTHTLLDPQSKLIIFFVPLNGSTILNALVMDYSEGIGQEDDPGPRKWGLDVYPNPINGSLRLETTTLDHPGMTNEQALYFASTKIYENVGTNDDGATIDMFYETAHLKAGEAGQDLFGGIGYYVEGSGQLLVTLIGMDDVQQEALSNSAITAGIQLEEFGNIENERVRIRFETSGLNTVATFKSITMFAKPWAPQRPH